VSDPGTAVACRFVFEFDPYPPSSQNFFFFIKTTLFLASFLAIGQDNLSSEWQAGPSSLDLANLKARSGRVCPPAEEPLLSGSFKSVGIASNPEYLAGDFVGAHFTRRNGRDQSSEADVLVLGAGAAGIAAARVLHDAELRVIVLEARRRLGGRIHTDYSLAPHPIELGAEFIHGKNAITWKFLDRYRFGAIPDANHGYCFVQDQLFRDDAAPVPQSEDLLSNLKAKAREHLAAGKPDRGVYALLAEQRNSPWQRPSAITVQLLNNLIASEKGADLDKMSLSGLLEHDFSGYGDNNFRVVEGYAKLLSRLADPLDVRFRQAVEWIDWDRRGATLHCRGQSFRAAHVVITLPLGVLQEGDVKFHPCLPKEKTQAIQGLGAAPVCKIILTFREKFWPDYLAVLATTGDTQVWWPAGWGRADAAPILTALVGGKAARRFAKMGDEAVPEALRQLQVMFGRKLAKLFEGGRIVRWHRKRYSKMGFSFLPVGSSPLLRDRLAEPIAPTLFFAGEASSRHQPSTVHGALESGVRAARQVLEVMERPSLAKRPGFSIPFRS
jgi:monoamine oxidase